MAPQWSPLISGHQPGTSARLGHRGPALTRCPWRQSDACSLKSRGDKIIQLEKIQGVKIISHCCGSISYLSEQMKPVLLEVLQHEPTQQAEIKSLIDWQ